MKKRISKSLKRILCVALCAILISGVSIGLNNIPAGAVIPFQPEVVTDENGNIIENISEEMSENVSEEESEEVVPETPIVVEEQHFDDPVEEEPASIVEDTSEEDKDLSEEISEEVESEVASETEIEEDESEVKDPLDAADDDGPDLYTTSSIYLEVVFVNYEGSATFTAKKADGSEVASCTFTGNDFQTIEVPSNEQIELGYTVSGKGSDRVKCSFENVKGIFNEDNYSLTAVFTYQEECKHEHTRKEVVVEPSFYNEGVENIICEDCNTIVSTEKIARVVCEHKNTSEKTFRKATYTSRGINMIQCNDCFDIIKLVPVAKLVDPNKTTCEHSRKEIIDNSTCVKRGTKRVICEKCGEIFEETSLPLKDHTWNDGVITTAATCETNGVKTYTCTVCGVTKTETIPAIGHEYVLKDTKKATCAEAGYNTYACKNCGKERTDILPKNNVHTWAKDYEVTKEATCTEYGEKVNKCTVCGKVLDTKRIEKTAHKYEWVVTKEPTTTTTGTKAYTCKDCGKVAATEDIAKKACEHINQKAVLVKEATCTSKPLYNMVCKDCNAIIKTNVTKTTDTVDKNNHTNLKNTITKQPTYKEAGVRSYTCSDCGYKKTESIPKLTCTHKGSTTTKYNSTDGKFYIICDTCGENLGLSSVQDPTVKECKHSHGYTEKVIKKATATQWGKVQKICKDCNKVLSEHDVHPYSTYTVQYTDGHTETIYGYFDNDEVQEVYNQLNAYRKANGLSELNYNSTLQWASNQRALDCITYFEHTRPNGQRWNTITSEWTYGGENIALGYTNASKVMTGWKNSPGHNSNMLYKTYQGVSIGCFKRVVFDNGSNIHRVCNTTWSQNFTFYKY